MNTLLFHKSLFWPAQLPVKNNRPIFLKHTAHALEQSARKGFLIPTSIPEKAELIEAEILIEGRTKRVSKLVFRFRYDSLNDIVAVVRGNTLITAWINARSDIHATLDPSKYHNKAI